MTPEGHGPATSKGNLIATNAGHNPAAQAMARVQQGNRRFFISTTISGVSSTIHKKLLLGRVPMTMERLYTLQNTLLRGHIPSAQRVLGRLNVSVHVGFYLISFLPLTSGFRDFHSLPITATPSPLAACLLFFFVSRFFSSSIPLRLRPPSSFSSSQVQVLYQPPVCQ